VKATFSNKLQPEEDSIRLFGASLQKRHNLNPKISVGRIAVLSSLTG
jgi:hypothetical protein